MAGNSRPWHSPAPPRAKIGMSLQWMKRRSANMNTSPRPWFPNSSTSASLHATRAKSSISDRSCTFSPESKSICTLPYRRNHSSGGFIQLQLLAHFHGRMSPWRTYWSGGTVSAARHVSDHRSDYGMTDALMRSSPSAACGGKT